MAERDGRGGRGGKAERAAERAWREAAASSAVELGPQLREGERCSWRAS